MVTTFRSTESSPQARGEEFGARFANQIARNIDRYQRLFLLSGQCSLEDIRRYSEGVFPLIRSHADTIAEELQGMARGANVLLSDVVALNARTELLAICGAKAPPECSVILSLNDGTESGRPIAMQTWDWLSELSDGWLLWTIEADDGHVIRTLTEYGIVGKIGLSSAGTGVLLNILSHEADGRPPIGMPVHVAARTILEERVSLNAAIGRIAAGQFTSSSAISVVSRTGPDVTGFSVEFFPGGPAFCIPDEAGLLIHTNHFLSPAGAAGDRAPKWGSSSFSRYEQLRRKLSGRKSLTAAEILEAMSSHAGGSHAVCSHPLPDARFGERSETLAVIQLDVGSGEIRVKPGGPCGSQPWVTIGPDRPPEST